MNCNKCGVENDGAAKFCSKCGQSLSPELTCAKCGNPLKPDAKFCAECGNNVVKATLPNEISVKKRLVHRVLRILSGIGLLTLVLSGASYLMAEWIEKGPSSHAVCYIYNTDLLGLKIVDYSHTLDALAQGNDEGIKDSLMVHGINEEKIASVLQLLKKSNNPAEFLASIPECRVLHNERIKEIDVWKERARNMLYATPWILVVGLFILGLGSFV